MFHICSCSTCGRQNDTVGKESSVSMKRAFVRGCDCYHFRPAVSVVDGPGSGLVIILTTIPSAAISQNATRQLPGACREDSRARQAATLAACHVLRAPVCQALCLCSRPTPRIRCADSRLSRQPCGSCTCTSRVECTEPPRFLRPTTLTELVCPSTDTCTRTDCTARSQYRGYLHADRQSHWPVRAAA